VPLLRGPSAALAAWPAATYAMDSQLLRAAGCPQ